MAKTTTRQRAEAIAALQGAFYRGEVSREEVDRALADINRNKAKIENRKKQRPMADKKNLGVFDKIGGSINFGGNTQNQGVLTWAIGIALVILAFVLGQNTKPKRRGRR